jgi:IstB-like ATP binding protein
LVWETYDVSGLSNVSCASLEIAGTQAAPSRGQVFAYLACVFAARPLCFQKQMASYELLLVHELGFVPLSKSGAELLFEVFSQRYERGSTLVTSNLPFQEWTEVLGSERLTGALLDRLTHHVHILEMNGESYRLKQSKHKRSR